MLFSFFETPLILNKISCIPIENDFNDFKNYITNFIIECINYDKILRLNLEVT